MARGIIRHLVVLAAMTVMANAVPFANNVAIGAVVDYVAAADPSEYDDDHPASATMFPSTIVTAAAGTDMSSCVATPASQADSSPTALLVLASSSRSGFGDCVNVGGPAATASQEPIGVLEYPSTTGVDDTAFANILPSNKGTEKSGHSVMVAAGGCGSPALSAIEDFCPWSSPMPPMTAAVQDFQPYDSLDHSSFARILPEVGGPSLPASATALRARPALPRSALRAAAASESASEPTLADGGGRKEQKLPPRETASSWGVDVAAALSGALVVGILGVLFHKKSRNRVKTRLRKGWTSLKRVCDRPKPKSVAAGADGAAAGADGAAAAAMDELAAGDAEMTMDQAVAAVSTVAPTNPPHAHSAITRDSSMSGVMAEGSAQRPADDTETDMCDTAPLVAGAVRRSTGQGAGVTADAEGRAVVKPAISEAGQVATLGAEGADVPPHHGVIDHGSPSAGLPQGNALPDSIVAMAAPDSTLARPAPAHSRPVQNVYNGGMVVNIFH